MHQILAWILAAPPSEAPGGGGGKPPDTPNMFLILLLPLVILFVLMPLFNKKDKVRKKRLGELNKHDKVITTGGILGTIAALDETTVTLEIAKDVRVKIKRTSIYDLQTPPADPKKALPAKTKAKAKK